MAPAPIEIQARPRASARGQPSTQRHWQGVGPHRPALAALVRWTSVGFSTSQSSILGPAVYAGHQHTSDAGCYAGFSGVPSKLPVGLMRFAAARPWAIPPRPTAVRSWRTPHAPLPRSERPQPRRAAWRLAPGDAGFRRPGARRPRTASSPDRAGAPKSGAARGPTSPGGVTGPLCRPLRLRPGGLCPPHPPRPDHPDEPDRHPVAGRGARSGAGTLPGHAARPRGRAGPARQPVAGARRRKRGDDRGASRTGAWATP